MKNCFDAVADAIVNVSAVDRALITPEKHIIDDLNVDSLDFLDITFEIDNTLGIRLPTEEWLQRIKDEGNSDALVMKNFVAFVEAAARTQSA